MLVIQGCTIKAAINTPEISPFISRPELLTSYPELPFDLFWSEAEVSTWLFDTIIIQQVRFDDVDENDWIFSTGTFIRSKKSYLDRVFDLSTYLHKSVAQAFRNRAEMLNERKLRVSEEAPQIYYNRSLESVFFPASPLPLYDPVSQENRVLLVQVSLSEVTFGEPLLYAGMFAVPVPGIANMSTSIRSPSLIMKARFVDKESGQVIAELIDRRFPQLKLVDLNRMVIGYALQEIADSFADDLALLFFRQRGEAIRRRSPISLLPW
jgi:hypothetical protein